MKRAVAEQPASGVGARPPTVPGDRALLALKAVLWLLLFGFFVEIEFGALFVAASVLVLAWANTSTAPRRAGEKSAYSVFNARCESIDGTLTAEQFERELRHKL